MGLYRFCVLVSLVTLALAGLVIWSSWEARVDTRQLLLEQKMEQTDEIFKTLHSLHFLQEGTDVTSQEHLVYRHFPWLTGRVLLENYFLYRHFIGADRYHSRYSLSPMSVLKFFHDYEGEFGTCLRRTALYRKEAVTPEMTFATRHKWDATPASAEGIFRFKHKFKIHFGSAAFGVGCTNADDGRPTGGAITKKCGQVLILQDPLRFALSEYGQCLLTPDYAPSCQSIHQHQISVKEWIVSRGSVVFKSLLYSSRFCRQNSEVIKRYKMDMIGRSHPRDDTHVCQAVQSDHLDSLEPEVVRRLLDFITSNLKSWFSFVGLYEDLLKTSRLFHLVFRVPVHECEFLNKYNSKAQSFRSSRHDVVRSSEPNLAIPGQTRGSKLAFSSQTADDTQPQKEVPSLASLVKDGDELSLLRTLSRLENVQLLEQAGLSLSSRHVQKEINAGNSNIDSDVTFPEITDDTSLHESADVKGFVDLLTNSSDGGIPKNSSAAISRTTRAIDFVEEIYDEDEFESDGYGEDNNEEVWTSNGWGRQEVVSKFILKSEERNTNQVWDALYGKLSGDPDVQQALYLDNRIYEAAREIYRAQTQIVFNTIKDF
ncbi:uncharacterized protein LOC106012402 [Aplysia californica]|uniref:Uncharacterized protein LOC106012402 n=1 Tax=Aplysia californica TaxID=6500 RepID=A0ABM1A4M2_APLCA|nr:uncharacterized protein LOC106012402 [Aplysia californica]